MHAPHIAAHPTPRPPSEAAPQSTASVAKSTMETLVSRPSRPSSRLALLVVPTMMNIIIGIYQMPKSHSTRKNGTLMTEPTCGWK